MRSKIQTNERLFTGFFIYDKSLNFLWLFSYLSIWIDSTLVCMDSPWGPYNRGYLAALRFFPVAGKHDSRDKKINLKINFCISAFLYPGPRFFYNLQPGYDPLSL